MGYNKGDIYEHTIFLILQTKKILSKDSTRAGAGGGADIKFLHKSQECNLEVKLDLKADYGQKMLKWNDEELWSWCKTDSVTEFYTSLDLLNKINRKKIVPNRFTIPKKQITTADKQKDQQVFEDSIDIDINALYDFYANKNCYYIQVGGYGFYHLQQDILSLGTPQFICQMRLRLRAKTIHSQPVYNYGFYAVLKVLKTRDAPQKSKYDLEEKDSRSFPPIMP